MKKTFLIGFMLLGIVAKGELGTDIKLNQSIIDNIKVENSKLREEVKRLTLVLNELEKNFVKEIKFENLGLEIRRDLKTFTLKIVNEDLRQGGYNDILDDFIDAIKYDPNDPIIFEGSKINVEFLNSHFISKGIDPDRITLKIQDDSHLTLENEEEILVDTKIIITKKEN